MQLKMCSSIFFQKNIQSSTIDSLKKYSGVYFSGWAHLAGAVLARPPGLEVHVRMEYNYYGIEEDPTYPHY